MTERPLRIVVLDGGGDPRFGELTAAVAAALASEQPSGEAGRRGSEAPSPHDLLHAADAVVALDDGSLLRAQESGASLCVALLPGFDPAWPGDLSGADSVLVSHEALVDPVVRRGARRADVAVVGPIAPRGYAPAADRAALAAELGLEGDAPLVLVPADVLEEEGPDAVAIQLGLVSRPARFLFYVGNDADVSDQLRRLAPLHGLDAWMFADEPGAERYWQASDVVVGRARGYEVARALAVGAPLVLMPAGRSGAPSVHAIEQAGVGRDADVLATLAVTLESALEPDALAEARTAIEALEMSRSGDRLAAAVKDAWSRHSEPAAKREPRGLPHGLERLPTGDRAPRRSSVPPSNDDLEARIDRELAELKKRL